MPLNKKDIAVILAMKRKKEKSLGQPETTPPSEPPKNMVPIPKIPKVDNPETIKTPKPPKFQKLKSIIKSIK